MSPAILSNNQRQQQALKAGVMNISPPKAHANRAAKEQESPKRNFSPVRNYINSKAITKVKRVATHESQEKQQDQHCSYMHDKSKSAETRQQVNSSANHTISMLNQKREAETDEQKPRRITRESRKNQLTFGMPTKNISRAESKTPNVKMSNREKSAEEVQLKMAPRIMQSSSAVKTMSVKANVELQEERTGL